LSFKEHGYSSALVAKISEVHHAAHEIPHEAHTIAMGLSVLLGLLGIAFAFSMYFERRDGSTLFNPAWFTARFAPIHKLLSRKYYMDEFYDAVFVKPVLALGRFMAKFDRSIIDSAVDGFGKGGKQAAFAVEIVDRRVVDGVGVLGTADFTAYCGERLSLLQSGYLRQYFFLTVAALVLAGGVYLALV
jgi:NADH:ubiquinone oxidoreductase subunit 5 (subunit L)/multisubunit Na+/H+ antiporter MnhA subunit